MSGYNFNFVEDPLGVSADEFAQDDQFKQWITWPYAGQLIEVTGEAEYLLTLTKREETAHKQWEIFNRYCKMTFASPTTPDYIKEGLWYSYKDVYEYVFFPEKTTCKSAEAALRWFKEWFSPFYLKEAGLIK